MDPRRHGQAANGSSKRKSVSKSNGPQFTIPRLKKIKRELLTELSLDSRECQNDILAPLRKSFHFPASNSTYEFTRIQSVHNSSLVTKYLDKRKDMKSNGYPDSLVVDTIAFVPVEHSFQAEKMCKDGIQCGNQKVSSLGVANMAVHACKHADIVGPVKPKTGDRILLMVKILKGRIKMILCKGLNCELEPTPNFDCHMARLNVDQLATQTLPLLFYNSQVYLYEYGDFDLEDYPRQILPFAIVHYRIIEPITKNVTNLPYTGQPVNNLAMLPGPAKAVPLWPVQKQLSVLDAVVGPANEVWHGRLHIRLMEGGHIYIDAVMLSDYVPLTVNLMSPIKIHSLYPEHNAQFTFLNGLSNLAHQAEVEWRAHFFRSYVMRPRPHNEDHFKALVRYISAKREMPTVRLPSDIFLFMMPNCLLASQLGFARQEDNGPLLHCVLMSKFSTSESRKKKLAARKLSLPSYGTARSWEELFNDSDFSDDEEQSKESKSADQKNQARLSKVLPIMFGDQHAVQNKFASMSLVDSQANLAPCSCHKIGRTKALMQQQRDFDIKSIMAALQQSTIHQPTGQKHAPDSGSAHFPPASRHKPKTRMSHKTRNMPSFSPQGSSDSDSDSGTTRRGGRSRGMSLLHSTKTVEEELSEEEEMTTEQMEDIIFMRKKPTQNEAGKRSPLAEGDDNTESPRLHLHNLPMSVLTDNSSNASTIVHCVRDVYCLARSGPIAPQIYFDLYLRSIFGLTEINPGDVSLSIGLDTPCLRTDSHLKHVAHQCCAGDNILPHASCNEYRELLEEVEFITQSYLHTNFKYGLADRRSTHYKRKPNQNVSLCFAKVKSKRHSHGGDDQITVDGYAGSFSGHNLLCEGESQTAVGKSVDFVLDHFFPLPSTMVVVMPGWWSHVDQNQAVPECSNQHPVQLDVSQSSPVQHDISQVTIQHFSQPQLSSVQHDVPHLSLARHAVSQLSPSQHDVSQLSLLQLDVCQSSAVQQDVSKLLPVQTDVCQLLPIQHEVSQLFLIQPDDSQFSPVQLDDSQFSPVQPDDSQFSPVQPDDSQFSPVRHNISQLPSTQYDVSQLSTTMHNVSQLSSVDHDISQLLPEQHDVSHLLSVQNNIPQLSTTVHDAFQCSQVDHNVSQPLSLQQDASQCSQVDHNVSQPLSLQQDASQLSSIQHDCPQLPKIHDVSQLSAAHHEVSQFLPAQHNVCLLSLVDHNVCLLSSVDHGVPQSSATMHGISQFLPVPHPVSQLSSEQHAVSQSPTILHGDSQSLPVQHDISHLLQVQNGVTQLPVQHYVSQLPSSTQSNIAQLSTAQNNVFQFSSITQNDVLLFSSARQPDATQLSSTVTDVTLLPSATQPDATQVSSSGTDNVSRVSPTHAKVSPLAPGVESESPERLVSTLQHDICQLDEQVVSTIKHDVCQLLQHPVSRIQYDICQSPEKEVSTAQHDACHSPVKDISRIQHGVCHLPGKAVSTIQHDIFQAPKKAISVNQHSSQTSKKASISAVVRDSSHSPDKAVSAVQYDIYQLPDKLISPAKYGDCQLPIKSVLSTQQEASQSPDRSVLTLQHDVCMSPNRSVSTEQHDNCQSPNSTEQHDVCKSPNRSVSTIQHDSCQSPNRSVSTEQHDVCQSPKRSVSTIQHDSCQSPNRSVSTEQHDVCQSPNRSFSTEQHDICQSPNSSVSRIQHDSCQSPDRSVSTVQLNIGHSPKSFVSTEQHDVSQCLNGFVSTEQHDICQSPNRSVSTIQHDSCQSPNRSVSTEQHDNCQSPNSIEQHDVCQSPNRSVSTIQLDSCQSPNRSVSTQQHDVCQSPNRSVSTEQHDVCMSLIRSVSTIQHDVCQSPNRPVSTIQHDSWQSPNRSVSTIQHDVCQSPNRSVSTQQHDVCQSPNRSVSTEQHDVCQSPNRSVSTIQHDSCQSPNRSVSTEQHDVCQSPNRSVSTEQHDICQSPNRSVSTIQHDSCQSPNRSVSTEQHDNCQSPNSIEQHDVCQSPNRSVSTIQHDSCQSPNRSVSTEKHDVCQSPSRPVSTIQHDSCQSPNRSVSTQQHDVCQSPNRSVSTEQHDVCMSPIRSVSTIQHDVCQSPNRSVSTEQHDVCMSPIRSVSTIQHDVCQSPNRSVSTEQHDNCQSPDISFSAIQHDVCQSLNRSVSTEQHDNCQLPGIFVSTIQHDVCQSPNSSVSTIQLVSCQSPNRSVSTVQHDVCQSPNGSVSTEQHDRCQSPDRSVSTVQLDVCHSPYRSASSGLCPALLEASMVDNDVPQVSVEGIFERLHNDLKLQVEEVSNQQSEGQLANVSVQPQQIQPSKLTNMLEKQKTILDKMADLKSSIDSLRRLKKSSTKFKGRPKAGSSGVECWKSSDANLMLQSQTANITDVRVISPISEDRNIFAALQSLEPEKWQRTLHSVIIIDVPSDDPSVEKIYCLPELISAFDKSARLRMKRKGPQSGQQQLLLSPYKDNSKETNTITCEESPQIYQLNSGDTFCHEISSKATNSFESDHQISEMASKPYDQTAKAAETQIASTENKQCKVNQTECYIKRRHLQLCSVKVLNMKAILKGRRTVDLRKLSSHTLTKLGMSRPQQSQHDDTEELCSNSTIHSCSNIWVCDKKSLDINRTTHTLKEKTKTPNSCKKMVTTQSIDTEGTSHICKVKQTPHSSENTETIHSSEENVTPQTSKKNVNTYPGGEKVTAPDKVSNLEPFPKKWTPHASKECIIQTKRKKSALQSGQKKVMMSNSPNSNKSSNQSLSDLHMNIKPRLSETSAALTHNVVRVSKSISLSKDKKTKNKPTKGRQNLSPCLSERRFDDDGSQDVGSSRSDPVVHTLTHYRIPKKTKSNDCGTSHIPELAACESVTSDIVHISQHSTTRANISQMVASIGLQKNTGAIPGKQLCLSNSAASVESSSTEITVRQSCVDQWSSEAKVSKPVTTNGQVSKPVTTNAQVSKPVTTNAQVSKPVITNAQVSKPVTTNAQVSKPVTTNAQVSKPVTTNAQVSKSVTTNAQVSKPVTTNAQVSKSISTNAQVSKPVTISNQVSNPMTTNAPVSTSVATNVEMSNPVTTKMQVSKPVETNTVFSISTVTRSNIAQPVSDQATNAEVSEHEFCIDDAEVSLSDLAMHWFDSEAAKSTTEDISEMALKPYGQTAKAAETQTASTENKQGKVNQTECHIKRRHLQLCSVKVLNMKAILKGRRTVNLRKLSSHTLTKLGMSGPQQSQHHDTEELSSNSTVHSCSNIWLCDKKSLDINRTTHTVKEKTKTHNSCKKMVTTQSIDTEGTSHLCKVKQTPHTSENTETIHSSEENVTQTSKKNVNTYPGGEKVTAPDKVSNLEPFPKKWTPHASKECIIQTKRKKSALQSGQRKVMMSNSPNSNKSSNQSLSDLHMNIKPRLSETSAALTHNVVRVSKSISLSKDKKTKNKPTKGRQNLSPCLSEHMFDDDGSHDVGSSRSDPVVHTLTHYRIPKTTKSNDCGTSHIPEPAACEFVTSNIVHISQHSTTCANISQMVASIGLEKNTGVIPEKQLCLSNSATSVESSSTEITVRLSSVDQWSSEAKVSKPVTTNAQVSKPVTTNAQVSKPVTTSAQVSKPVTTNAQVSKPVTTNAQVSKPVTTNAQVSKPVTTNAQVSKPVTTNAQVSKPVTTNAQVSKPVTTNAKVSKPVTTNAQVSKPVTTNAQVSKPVTTNAQVSKPVTTNAQVSKHVTTSAQVSKPVTTSAQVSKPVTTNAQVSKPVTTNEQVSKPLTGAQVSKPVTTSAQVSKPVTTSAQVSKPMTTNAQVSKPVTNNAQVSKSISTNAQVSKPVTISNQVSNPMTTNAPVSTSMATNVEMSKPVTTKTQVSKPVETNAVFSVSTVTRSNIAQPVSDQATNAEVSEHEFCIDDAEVSLSDLAMHWFDSEAAKSTTEDHHMNASLETSKKPTSDMKFCPPKLRMDTEEPPRKLASVVVCKSRISEKVAEDRRSRRGHPYSRPDRSVEHRDARRANQYSTFDLAYDDLQELLQCMTLRSYRHANKRCRQEDKTDTGRFTNYVFVRSSQPVVDEREPDVKDLLRPEDIKDLVKREEMADLAEEMAEQSVLDSFVPKEELESNLGSPHKQEPAIMEPLVDTLTSVEQASEDDGTRTCAGVICSAAEAFPRVKNEAVCDSKVEVTTQFGDGASQNKSSICMKAEKDEVSTGADNFNEKVKAFDFCKDSPIVISSSDESDSPKVDIGKRFLCDVKPLRELQSNPCQLETEGSSGGKLVWGSPAQATKTSALNTRLDSQSCSPKCPVTELDHCNRPVCQFPPQVHFAERNFNMPNADPDLEQENAGIVQMHYKQDSQITYVNPQTKLTATPSQPSQTQVSSTSCAPFSKQSHFASMTTPYQYNLSTVVSACNYPSSTNATLQYHNQSVSTSQHNSPQDITSWYHSNQSTATFHLYSQSIASWHHNNQSLYKPDPQKSLASRYPNNWSPSCTPSQVSPYISAELSVPISKDGKTKIPVQLSHHSNRPSQATESYNSRYQFQATDDCGLSSLIKTNSAFSPSPLSHGPNIQSHSRSVVQPPATEESYLSSLIDSDQHSAPACLPQHLNSLSHTTESCNSTYQPQCELTEEPRVSSLIKIDTGASNFWDSALYNAKTTPILPDSSTTNKKKSSTLDMVHSSVAVTSSGVPTKVDNPVLSKLNNLLSSCIDKMEGKDNPTSLRTARQFAVSKGSNLKRPLPVDGMSKSSGGTVSKKPSLTKRIMSSNFSCSRPVGQEEYKIMSPPPPPCPSSTPALSVQPQKSEQPSETKDRPKRRRPVGSHAHRDKKWKKMPAKITLEKCERVYEANPGLKKQGYCILLLDYYPDRDPRALKNKKENHLISLKEKRKALNGVGGIRIVRDIPTQPVEKLKKDIASPMVTSVNAPPSSHVIYKSDHMTNKSDQGDTKEVKVASSGNVSRQAKKALCESASQQTKDTPSGTVSRQTKDTPTGTVSWQTKETPSGAVSRQTKETPSGTVSRQTKDTPSGTVSRQTKDTPTGTVSRQTKDTPSGTVSRQTKNTPSGTVSRQTKDTPTGTVSRQTKDTPSGTVSWQTKETPLGTVSRQTKDTPTGTVSRQTKDTPSGTVSRQTKDTPTGTVSRQTKDTPTGTVSRQTKETPSGAVSRQTKDTPSGTVSRQTKDTPSGTVSRQTKDTPSGTVSRQTKDTPTGTVSRQTKDTPSGTVSRQTKETPSGTVSRQTKDTPAGTVSRQTKDTPTGTVSWQTKDAPSGTVSQQTKETPSGTVSRQTKDTPAGTVSQKTKDLSRGLIQNTNMIDKTISELDILSRELPCADKVYSGEILVTAPICEDAIPGAGNQHSEVNYEELIRKNTHYSEKGQLAREAVIEEQLSMEAVKMEEQLSRDAVKMEEQLSREAMKMEEQLSRDAVKMKEELSREDDQHSEAVNYEKQLPGSNTWSPEVARCDGHLPEVHDRFSESLCIESGVQIENSTTVGGDNCLLEMTRCAGGTPEAEDIESSLLVLLSNDPETKRGEPLACSSPSLINENNNKTAPASDIETELSLLVYGLEPPESCADIEVGCDHVTNSNSAFGISEDGEAHVKLRQDEMADAVRESLTVERKSLSDTLCKDTDVFVYKSDQVSCEFGVKKGINYGQRMQRAVKAIDGDIVKKCDYFRDRELVATEPAAESRDLTTARIVTETKDCAKNGDVLSTKACDREKEAGNTISTARIVTETKDCAKNGDVLSTKACDREKEAGNAIRTNNIKGVLSDPTKFRSLEQKMSHEKPVGEIINPVVVDLSDGEIPPSPRSSPESDVCIGRAAPLSRTFIEPGDRSEAGEEGQSMPSSTRGDISERYVVISDDDRHPTSRPTAAMKPRRRKSKQSHRHRGHHHTKHKSKSPKECNSKTSLGSTQYHDKRSQSRSENYGRISRSPQSNGRSSSGSPQSCIRKSRSGLEQKHVRESSSSSVQNFGRESGSSQSSRRSRSKQNHGRRPRSSKENDQRSRLPQICFKTDLFSKHGSRIRSPQNYMSSSGSVTVFERASGSPQKCKKSMSNQNYGRRSRSPQNCKRSRSRSPQNYVGRSQAMSIQSYGRPTSRSPPNDFCRSRSPQTSGRKFRSNQGKMERKSLSKRPLSRPRSPRSLSPEFRILSDSERQSKSPPFKKMRDASDTGRGQCLNKGRELDAREIIESRQRSKYQDKGQEVENRQGSRCVDKGRKVEWEQRSQLVGKGREVESRQGSQYLNINRACGEQRNHCAGHGTRETGVIAAPTDALLRYDQLLTLLKAVDLRNRQGKSWRIEVHLESMTDIDRMRSCLEVTSPEYAELSRCLALIRQYHLLGVVKLLHTCICRSYLDKDLPVFVQCLLDRNKSVGSLIIVCGPYSTAVDPELESAHPEILFTNIDSMFELLKWRREPAN